jgi:putative transcriptional regulator
MSKENTIVAKRERDGTLVRQLADGQAGPLEDKTDWKRLRAMTDAEVEAAALGDPDAQPLTEDRLATMSRVPRARTLRRALGLTQEEFAARFQIPLGTLRDWEQGRAQPDQTARSYLRAIAGDAEAVRRALLNADRPPR